MIPPFSFESEKKPLPRRIIILDLQIHDGTDPGEGVSKSAEQGSIAEASVRGIVSIHIQKLVEPYRRRMPASCPRSVKISRS